MAGGSFPFFSVSRYTSAGQAKFVSNVGLVPEASASSCSSVKYIRKTGMWGLTDGAGIGIRGGGGSSSRYEASSSRYSSELGAASSGGQVQRCCCDPSSSTVAGGQLVLDLAKSSTNGTLVPDAAAAAGAFKATSNCASPCISWNGQKHCHSVYMDNSRTTTIQNLLPWESVYNLNGQRACAGYGSQAQTTSAAEATSHEFKPDDASSHNNMLRTSCGDLGVAFPTRNNKDLKVEDLAGLSESINESLLQEDRVNAPQKPSLIQMEAPAKSGSKRKAVEIVKRPLAGAQVQSERNYNTLHESRIVRVSRLTGGKDRHSKVRTAKGLRDRRVRLSVPTAIQFYDLQDRLGYDQPSMAVEWLIKVAKAAIDELPVQDMDTDRASGAALAAAEAGSNLSQLTSTNCSPVKSAHGSPIESATAAAAAVTDLTALQNGVCFVNNERKISKKEMNGQLGSKKDSEVGRSSSSTSDGSIVGAEYTSKSSLSKSARLKEARERRRKKLASARNPAVSSQLTQPNSLQSSPHSHLMNILGHSATIPLESQYGRDGSPSGISNQVSARIGSEQPLWDYDLQSYTDITDKGSRQFQHLGALNSSPNGSLENSSSCMQPVLSSSYQSYEMADSGITYFDPKQRNMGGNTSQINSNLSHSNQQQPQSQAMQKHFASTFPSPFSNDVNFLTSGLCGRGPLQSNSSCIINTPSLQNQKHAYADAATKVSMFPFIPYDAGTPEWFILEGNAKYEIKH